MPTKTYTDEDLGKTLDKLDHQLSKSETEQEDTSADLVKALAAATKGAIDLATESKERRKGKKKAKESPLAKAAKDDDDDKDDKDDDSKDDDDDDKLPAWLKDKVDDGKAAGEMQYAGDRDDYGGTSLMTNAGHESRQMGKHLGKSVQIGDMEVVDVGDYLASSLRQIEALSKALDRSERREKTLIKGLLAMEERLIHLEEQNEDQARFTSICAKALGHMLESRETYLEQPAGPSRYATMEKSIALAQRQADHEGATYFKMKGEGSQSNMELLSKAVMTRKITPEQAAYIKKTERLPAGISLN
jgi:predicted nucleic acid-binding Zn ribbon protein